MASEFLRNKASQRAKEIDRLYGTGEPVYGGTQWLNEPQKSTADPVPTPELRRLVLPTAEGTGVLSPQDRIRSTLGMPSMTESAPARRQQAQAQLQQDRRQALETELYQLTQPGRVYNQDTTAQNRARVQEIEHELSMLPARDDYNPLMSVAGAVRKGLGMVAQGGADTFALAEDAVYAPFELVSGLKLGDLSDQGFFNQWADDIRRESESANQFFQENMERGGKPAELLETLGASAVAAIPQAGLALATAGGSAAAQTAGGLSRAAASQLSPGVAATVRNTVQSMSKNPQFWTSFSQVVGSGYEDAIADQRARGETDENLIRTKAALFAIGNGLLNSAVEVGGGIETLPAQLQSGGSAWRSWVDSMVDEGKEEVVQGVIERALQNPIYQQGNPLFSTTDPNAILNPATAAQEFAGGAVVGGLLGGGQIALQRLARGNQQGGNAQTRPGTPQVELPSEPGQRVVLPGGIDNPSIGGYDGAIQENQTGGTNDVRGEAGPAARQGAVGADVRGEARGAEEAYPGRMGRILEESGGRDQVEGWARGHIVTTPSQQAERASQNARQYIREVFAVDDSALKARSPRTWALTSGGRIYISDSIPAELSDVVGYHEVVHAIRQQGNQAYQGFLSNEYPMLDHHGERTQDILDLVVESRFPGKNVLDLTTEEALVAYDELNALVWGYHKADPENARAQFSGVFRDYDAYIRELDAIMEEARQTGGETNADLHGGQEGGAQDGVEPSPFRPFSVELPRGDQWIQKKKGPLVATSDASVSAGPAHNAQSVPPSGPSTYSIPAEGQEVNPESSGQVYERSGDGASLSAPVERDIPNPGAGANRPGVNGYGPNTVGSAQARFPYRQRNSKAGSNTFSKMYKDLLDDMAQNGGNITKLPYDVASEAQSLEHAQQRLFADLEGEIADLPQKEAWSGEDLDTAMGILDRYMAEARESHDYRKVDEWARLIQSKGTAGGQMIQAFAKYSRSPQGILVDAVKVLDESRLSDAEKARVLDDVQTQVEALDALEDGDKASVIALIKENSRIRRTGSFFRNRVGRALDKALQADSYDHLKNVAAAQIDSIAKDYRPKSRAEKARNLRTMFMLSNLTTVLRNVVSNSVFGGVDSFAGSTAGVPLDILLSKATGTRSVAAENPLSQAARRGMADGALKSYIEVALDADASGAENRYEQTSNRTFRMTGNLVERFFSTWDKYLGYALTTTDELAKGGIRAETQRGIDRLKERGLIRKLKNGEWVEDTSLDTRGEEVARYRTFQDDSRLSKGLLTLRRGANEMLGVEGFGAGDMLAPFARVPANLVTRAVEYSPLGLANGAREIVSVLNKAHNGTLTAAEQARAVSDVSRGMTGSGLIAVFAALAAAGILNVAGNGEGEEDRTALETSEGVSGTQLNLSAAMRWLSKGNLLNILPGGEEPEKEAWRDGDTIISIGFLEPINAQMTTGALLAQELEENPDAGLWSRLESYGRSSVEGTLQSLLDLPAMSSLQSLANGYTYSDSETTGGRVADALIGYGASQVSSFIPNFVRTTARATDPYVRDTYSSESVAGQMIDSIKAGIPGLRQTLPIRQTPFGEDRTYGDSQFQNAANALLLPGNVSTYRTSDAAQELYRLPTVADNPVFPARNAPDTVSYGGKDHTLTPEQQTQYQKTYGQHYQTYINELTENAYYQSLAPEEQAKLISDARSYASDLAKREALEAQGVSYESSTWEKAYQAEQNGVPISDWIAYRDMRNKMENSPDESVSRNTNPAMRQIIAADSTLTAAQKSTLDEYLLNDLTVIPKDIDVDYSSTESFIITQMSGTAQEKWPRAEAWGMSAEDFAEYYAIYAESGKGKTKAYKLEKLQEAGMTLAEANYFWNLMDREERSG